MIGNSPSREHSSLVAVLTQLSDILAVLGVSIALYYAIPLVDPDPSGYLTLIMVAVLATGVVFNQLGLYRNHPVPLGATLPGWMLVFLLLSLFLFITKTSENFSRLWYVLWLVLGFVAVELGRRAVYRLVRSMRRAGLNRRRIIIVGAGELGKNTLNHLSGLDDGEFDVVAYFSDDEPSVDFAGWQGGESEACDFAENNSIDQVWLSFPFKQADRLEGVLKQFTHSVVDIRLVPDLYGFRLLNHSTSSVAGLSVVNLSMSPMDGFNRFIKDVEDKLISLVVLAAVSPLLLLIAIGVKVTSPGPVFFRQERMSWNGRCFKMYKFRSMHKDAESATGAVWATPDDQRTTRFGAFLRRTSLDELPQFFNVLKGDMSIVGPRPERPVFVDRFKDEIPGYMQKHKVKAGITGWAQVNGWRGDTDLEARIEHDLYYIEHWSLLFDIKIIILTIFRGFVHRNAY